MPPLSSADPPALTAGSVGDHSVTITWDSDDALVYDLEYAESSAVLGSWTDRLLGTSNSGQARFSSLAEETSYHFRIRARGKKNYTGSAYSTEWSRYSSTISVYTGPPPAPRSPVVSSTTETSVIISYGPVGGATYQVQYRKTTTDDSGSWDPYAPGAPVTGSLFQVDGLDSGTEYDFQVRAVGDGSWYKAEAGDWSEPSLVVRTAGFTAAFDAPPRTGLCARPRNATVVGPWEEHRSANGTMIQARAEIWTRLDANNRSDTYTFYCVQTRYTSKAESGADALTWSGRPLKTVASISPSDVTNPDNLTLGAIDRLYASVPKTEGARRIGNTKSYTCPYPCKGGTIQQTPEEMIPRNYIKTITIYAEGTHTFTKTGVSHTLTSDASWVMPNQGMYLLYGELPETHGALMISRYWANMALEIASDGIPNETVSRMVELLKGR